MPNVTITVTLDEAGSVSVHGPIENRVLCYGLLEVAKEVVAKYAEQRLVQPAPVEMISRKSRGRG